MIRLKTAVLFGFSFQFGGITGSGDETVSQQLFEAGVHLGLAFQLQDDLLDLYGGEKFGKQIGGDILNAKKTFLLVKVLELANDFEKQTVVKIMNNKIIADHEKINLVKTLYDQYLVKDLARKKVELHLQDFSTTIKNIDSSRSAKILDFVNSLANRAV